MSACAAPASLADLAAWRAGELPPAEEARLEEHLFGCDACARLAESLERLRAGVRVLVRTGHLAAAVTGDLVARAEAEGLRVRTYRVAPGALVCCTVAPSDDLVVLRLSGDFAGAARVDVEVEGVDAGGGARRNDRLEDVVVDRRTGEVVIVYPGDVVRGYPRSAWRFDVRAHGGGGARHVGTYRLDHTPWAP